MAALPRCRTCRGRIRFVRMESGRAMPVNPDVDPEGNVVARWDGSRWNFGRVLGAGDDVPLGWKRWRPHFADCEKTKQGTPRNQLF